MLTEHFDGIQYDGPLPMTLRLKDLVTEVAFPEPRFRPCYLRDTGEWMRIYKRNDTSMEGLFTDWARPYLLTITLAPWNHFDYNFAEYVKQFVVETVIDVAQQSAIWREMMKHIEDLKLMVEQRVVYTAFSRKPLTDDPDEKRTLFIGIKYLGAGRFNFEILAVNDVDGTYTTAFNTPAAGEPL